MIKYYFRDSSINKIAVSDNLKNNVWIYVEDPSTAEIKFLTEKIKLDRGYIADALDQYEVPRLEVENNAVYVYTRYPYGQENQIATAPITLIMTSDYVITISLLPLFFMEPYYRNRKLLHNENVSHLFLQIITQISSAYNYFLIKISRQIKSTSIRVAKINNDDIIRFVSFEEILNDFKPNLVRTNAALEQIMKMKKVCQDYNIKQEYIEDLYLNNKQLIEMVEDSIQSIRNIREGYTTILTNNLNKVIKLFTSLTVLLTVPTIISSIYGMNVKLPLQHESMAFLFVILIILIITGGMLIFFIKSDYL